MFLSILVNIITTNPPKARPSPPHDATSFFCNQSFLFISSFYTCNNNLESKEFP